VTVLRQELWSEENANAPFEKKPHPNGDGGPAAASA
jgi:hypothetical protein